MRYLSGFFILLEPTHPTIECGKGVTEMTVACAQNAEDRETDAISYFAKASSVDGQEVGQPQPCTNSPDARASCPVRGLKGCSKYSIVIIACPTDILGDLCSQPSDPVQGRTLPGGR